MIGVVGRCWAVVLVTMMLATGACGAPGDDGAGSALGAATADRAAGDNELSEAGGPARSATDAPSSQPGDDGSDSRPEPAPEPEPEAEADAGGESSAAPDPELEPEADAGGANATPDPELDALVDELVAFVEVERGHRFVTRPVVDVFEGEAFVAEYAAIIARETRARAQDYADATDLYRALGIIEPGQTLEAIFADFADAGVLGFYDPTTERIVLRGGDLDVLARTSLVHELVHALDDQVFDIDRRSYDDRTDEVSWTFSALLEGNATVIENRYRSTLSDGERADELEARRRLARGTSLRAFTDSFLDLQFGRYSIGARWVGGLWADGRDAVDAVFDQPPVTSEQVLRAGADPGPTMLSSESLRPTADAEPFDEGLFGQVAWRAILLDAVDPVSADVAADGWGGDWYVAWREAERACLRVHLAADSARDLDEYAEALERWAGAGSDREVFYPTADLIRVTACG